MDAELSPEGAAEPGAGSDLLEVITQAEAVEGEVVVDEAELLRRGRENIRAQRRNLGLDPDTGRPVRREENGLRLRPIDVPVPAIQSVDSALLEVMQVPRGFVMGVYHCSDKLPNGQTCDALVQRPGNRCPACAWRLAELERAERLAAIIAHEIPPMYQDVTWETLPTLLNEHGTGPRVAVRAERLATIRLGLETERRAVIIGPTGSGKTTIACAFLRTAIERGRSVAFVPATMLTETAAGETLYQKALRASEVVIDGLGEEAHGAQPNTGLLSMRIQMVDNLIRARIYGKQRTIVTTAHRRHFEKSDDPREPDRPGIEGIYGFDIARRIFNAAAEIEIGMGGDDAVG